MKLETATLVSRGRAGAVFVLGALTACSGEDGVLGRMSGSSVGGTSNASGATNNGSSGTSGASAGTSNPSGGTTSASTEKSNACEIVTPPVNLKSPTGSEVYRTCTGRLASTHFSNALCVCGSARVNDYLKTRGFDSNQGSYIVGQADDSGAAVAINGSYQALSGYTDVGGSLSVAGSGGVRVVGYLKGRGDFRAGGDVSVAGYASVSRNAWLAGSYFGIGPFTVSGEVHHASTVTAVPLLAGSDVLESVAIAAPCPCDTANVLDVGALVDQAASENDNARFGVDARALELVSGATKLSLPCGRFHLSEVAGTGNIILQISGMVALFIEGAVDLDGSVTVELAPGAELDLFVREDFDVRGTVTLGSRERPAAGRLYLGGRKDMVMQSPWIGNLYAPRARVLALKALEVWGSVFCAEFESAADANIVFDRAIYTVGSSCEAARPPAGFCSQCGFCSAGTACVDGECGPCRTDGDCCSQNICANGSCVPLVALQ